ncbi:hypothetical protein IQ280_04965 [Ochrobactrum anthropi]|nr:hypothetical protein [Brucella anthropi]
MFLTADRNGVFGAQPVAVGTYLGQRYRQFRLNLPARQKKARRQTEGPSRTTTKTVTRTPNMKKRADWITISNKPERFQTSISYS